MRAATLSFAAAFSLAALAHPATEWAKEELSTFSSRIFGFDPEAEFILPGGGGDFAADFKALKGTDGYAVRTKGGKVYFVADNPRGHVNGVHRWLERNSDVIWPRPAGEACMFTPRKGVRIEELDCDYLDVPAFRQRAIGGESVDVEVLRWRARNATWTPIRAERMPSVRALVPTDSCPPLAEEIEAEYRRCGAYGAFMDSFGYGHNMETLWLPRKLHLADHPEWYMLHDGRRGTGLNCAFCETNPELPAALAAAVLDKLSRLPPTIKIVHVCMQDTSLTCTCGECMKPLRLANGETISPDDSAFKSTRFFLMFNKAADMVGKVRPDVEIRQFAYHHLAIPPKIPVAKNVSLMFCPIPRNLKESLVEGESGREWRRRADGWLAQGAELCLYEYYLDGAVFPQPVSECVATDLRYFRGKGIRDVSTEAPGRFGDTLRRNYPGSKIPCSWFFAMGSLEAWTIGKLFWDPSLDPATLRSEFLRRTFGPAAEAVGEFYSLVHRAWRAGTEKARYDDDVFVDAARYVVGAGIAGRCADALERAEALADTPERRAWISEMRGVLATWTREASNYMDVAIEAPFSPDGSKRAEFPELKLSGTKECFNDTKSGFSIGVSSDALFVSVRVGKPFLAGEFAEVSFAAADGSQAATFPLSVTDRRHGRWTAEARIPFSALRFAPAMGAELRCLPRLVLKDGEKASALDFTWRGGVPGRSGEWGRVVAAKDRRTK